MSYFKITLFSLSVKKTSFLLDAIPPSSPKGNSLSSSSYLLSCNITSRDVSLPVIAIKVLLVIANNANLSSKSRFNCDVDSNILLKELNLDELLKGTEL